MVAWGKDKTESRVTAEFYNCAVEVMRGAEAIDEYIALPQQEAFDIEYWLLEEAKLKRMPAEKELARQIDRRDRRRQRHRQGGRAAAGEGGRAHRLRRSRTPTRREATAKEITDKYGVGIGVAGSGISELRPGHRARVPTSPSAPASARCSTRSRSRTAASTHRVTAGIFVAERHHRPHPRRQVGAHLRHQRDRQLPRRRRSREDWKEQGLPANLVLTTSAPTRSSRRKAASPTTPARPPRTTWCASWRSNSRRWCA